MKSWIPCSGALPDSSRLREMKETHRPACRARPTPRKLFPLLLSRFCSRPTGGFLALYPNSLKIIGRHNHSFSVLLQTACLSSHLNFHHNNWVSNETALLAAPENPARRMSEVSGGRQVLHRRLRGSHTGPSSTFSGASAGNYHPPFKGFWIVSVTRRILGLDLFGKL